MGFENLMIDPRLVVEAFNVGKTGKLAQVSVAGFIFCQQNQMEVRLSSTFALTIMTAAIGDVGFHAYDRLNSFLDTGLVKLDGAVHVSVVCQGEGFHALILRQANHVRDGVDPVQEAEVAVNMKMAVTISNLGQGTSGGVESFIGGPPRFPSF